MEFGIGERVGFLYEKGGGIVKRVQQGMYFVEDETGFERPFRKEELVKIYGSLEEEDVKGFSGKETETNTNKQHQRVIAASDKSEGDAWEIDLHIEELLPSHRGLSKHEILQKQLASFKRFFTEANAAMIRKLIVIHGVGEGRLKEEVRTFLDGKTHVEYYDASYREYGKGATEIRIYYHGKKP